MKKNDGILALLCAAALLALCAFCGEGPTEEQAMAEQYCAMVAAHKADPDIGWPDYNHTYDEECNEHAR